MKKLFLPAILFIAINSSASSEKIVKSNVKNVTVFTQGAQVFRTSSVNLSPGTTELIFNEVSPFINASSVQAGGKGNFIVLEVKHKVKYPEPVTPEEGVLPKEILKKIKAYEDSLTEIGFIREELTDQKSSLQMEKDMILKNKLMHGEGKSDSLPILKQAMEFFRIKLTDINARLGKIKRDEQRNAKEQVRITTLLADLKKYKNSEDPAVKYEPIHQVIVTVSADEAAIATVDVSYMVSNAGWVPSYDLRSTTTTAPVQLTYKANVHQTTGEDWDNIKLKLSTANPNRSNIKPVLPPWYLNYYLAKRESSFSLGARSASGENSNSDIDLQSASKSLNEESPAQSAANYSQIVETMANVMFDINLPYTIPSDGANHIVSVKTTELSASYHHYLVPKIEAEAFILAKVTGWEDMNLLPGRANVFYEGTYVGETVLNPAIINDTLDLAFGRDNGITITRTMQPVKESNKLIGNDITKTMSYVLKMKNNKNKTLNLIVEDQIPLTQNTEIKVEIKKYDATEYNEKTGMLKWNMALKAKEYKTLTFSYDVTYNKDKTLSLQ